MMRVRVLVMGVLAVAATVSSQLGARGQDPAGDENWKPEKIVNLEVLPKDTTPEQLMATMREWNEALNVGCVFCHKGQVGKPLSTFDFTDTSKKRHEVARQMARVTANLNTEFADLGDEGVKVTCATCHRRSRQPEVELPPKPAALLLPAR